MGVTIPADQLSDQVVRVLIAGGLAAAAADVNEPLTDPKEAERGPAGGAPFVMTAFPARNPYYPLIIASEAPSSGVVVDPQADIFEHPYSVNLDLYAESMTDLFKVRDQVRHWIQKNFSSLTAQGYNDVRITASVPTTWDPTSHVKSWRITIKGTVYTTTS